MINECEHGHEPDTCTACHDTAEIANLRSQLAIREAELEHMKELFEKVNSDFSDMVNKYDTVKAKLNKWELLDDDERLSAVRKQYEQNKNSQAAVTAYINGLLHRNSHLRRRIDETEKPKSNTIIEHLEPMSSGFSVGREHINAITSKVNEIINAHNTTIRELYKELDEVVAQRNEHAEKQCTYASSYGKSNLVLVESFDVLRKYMWKGHSRTCGVPGCICCGNSKDVGHDDDCQLAIFLALNDISYGEIEK